MELFRPASTSSPGANSSSDGENVNNNNNASGTNSGQNNQTPPGNMSTFDPRWDTYNMSQASSDTSASFNTDYPPDPALPKGPPCTDQGIVPQLLIDHYVSMIDPSRAQTVDSDIARHCAFSLPAVALTLGRSNWPLLRNTYEALATDMQWKVRRTLASSIHELGVILGQDAAGADLIPIFNGFLKDLDEVRIGLLKHLADFLRLLNAKDRVDYLPKLSEFLKMDNDRNWRFRLELTEQLEKMIPLYSPEEVEEHISPIAMALVKDKVASVRQCAINVVATVLQSLNSESGGRPELAQSLLANSIVSLAKETLWTHRQTFATLSLRIHSVSALSQAHFVAELLPQLLELSEDRVANVRLAVARTLSTMGKQTDFFRYEANNPWLQRQAEVEMNLKNDSDVDVRSFFGGSEKRYSKLSDMEVEQEEAERMMEEEFTDVGVSSRSP